MFKEELELLEGIDFDEGVTYTFTVEVVAPEEYGYTVSLINQIAENLKCECHTTDGIIFNITCKGSNIETIHDKMLHELFGCKVSDIREGEFFYEGLVENFYEVKDASGKSFGCVKAFDDVEAVDVATACLKGKISPDEVTVTKIDNCVDVLNEAEEDMPEVEDDDEPRFDLDDNPILDSDLPDDEFSDIVYFDNSKLFVAFNTDETGYWIGQDKDGTLVKIEGPFASREGAVDYYNQHPELESQSKEVEEGWLDGKHIYRYRVWYKNKADDTDIMWMKHPNGAPSRRYDEIKVIWADTDRQAEDKLNSDKSIVYWEKAHADESKDENLKEDKYSKQDLHIADLVKINKTNEIGVIDHIFDSTFDENGYHEPGYQIVIDYDKRFKGQIPEKIYQIDSESELTKVGHSDEYMEFLRRFDKDPFAISNESLKESNASSLLDYIKALKENPHVRTSSIRIFGHEVSFKDETDHKHAFKYSNKKDENEYSFHNLDNADGDICGVSLSDFKKQLDDFIVVKKGSEQNNQEAIEKQINTWIKKKLEPVLLENGIYDPKKHQVEIHGNYIDGKKTVNITIRPEVDYAPTVRTDRRSKFFVNESRKLVDWIVKNTNLKLQDKDSYKRPSGFSDWYFSFIFDGEPAIFNESLSEAVDYTEKTTDELHKLEEETSKKLDELITRLDTYVKQHRVEVDCKGDKLLVTTIKKTELGVPLLQGMWRKSEIGKDLKDCRSITIDKRGVDKISKNEFEALKQQVLEEHTRLTRIGEALVLRMMRNGSKAIRKQHEYVEPTKDEIKFLLDNITRIYVSVSEEHYERDVENLQKRIPQFDSDMIDKYVKVKKGQWALAIKAHLKTTDGLPLSIEDSVEPEKKMMNNTYKLAAVIASNWDTLKDRISKEEE